MRNRLLLVTMMLALGLAIACAKKAPPEKAEPAPAPIAAEAPPVAAPTPTPAQPEAAKPAALESPEDPEGPAPAAPVTATTAQERERLGQCYQAVYCAQKKGQMDRILELYKEHGFETPQDFTKAWIDAAKDTDWITKIAREVSKKCP